MNETYDAIIIGAGVIGSAINFELSKKGWKTLNIDKNPESPNDDYNIVETAGITSVSFTGVGVTNNYDVNVSSVPRGGIIVYYGIPCKRIGCG